MVPWCVVRESPTISVSDTFFRNRDDSTHAQARACELITGWVGGFWLLASSDRGIVFMEGEWEIKVYAAFGRYAFI